MDDYNEAMIDIETLSTECDAVIFQIGIIIFRGQDMIYNKKFDINFQRQIANGRDIADSTLVFQLQIPQVLHNSIVALERVELFEAMQAIHKISERFKPKYWWSKGSFDFDLLENACEDVPWKWYQKMDLRTLIRETGASKPDVAHDALRDCITQFAQLNECRMVAQKGRELIDLIKAKKNESTGKEGKAGDIETGSQTDPE